MILKIGDNYEPCHSYCGPTKDVMISLCTGPTSFSYLFLSLPPFSFVSDIFQLEKKYGVAKLSLVVLLHHFYFHEDPNR